MKEQTKLYINYRAFFTLLAAGLLLLPQTGFAATTGTTALFRQVGSGSSSAVGDYVSATAANGGMNSIYQFFLEVPVGTTQMIVRLFDADTGRTQGGNNNHDWQQGTGYNTSCRYTLYTPTGGTQVTRLIAAAAPGVNNGWYTLATVNTPAAGHWRLVSDMSSNATTGDDCNGWGFDVAGTNASGSVEIKAYAYSFVPVGELSQTGATTTTTLYPYITSGCSTNWKDFDGDSTTGACTITYRSRNGVVSGSYTGSASTVWLNYPISYTNDNFDNIAVESGIWTWTGTYTQTGAGGGNFGVFYAGNSNNATTPPTAQPQGNTFRIYLPSGTGNTPGGAPAKPVISQKLSIVSGNNPPINDVATRVRVEIIIFNPAVQTISVNPITAYIPGGNVVYAGNPVASQGSVTPPGGSPGTITWNVGNVAGNNSYATLYYEVNVTPDALTGPRYPVTGTPAAANGTTATYLDETGTTFTYGPLCELAVTRGGTPIPTWVAISCFEANMAYGQPMVEWHTAAENGTVGFYLWRKDAESKNYQLVNPNFLPALANAMMGGVYRLVDPNVQYSETVVYRIEEINARGDSLNYGPFTVTFDDAPANLKDTGNFYKKNSKEIPTTVNGFQSEVLTASEYEKSRQLARRNGLRTQGAKPMTTGSGQARIAVKSRGLYHVDAASIAAALGMSVVQVEGLIASQQLSLSTLGEPVAWLADGNRSGIYFYNENLQSPYSDQDIYWLEQGSGLALATVNGGTAAPADANQTFNATCHYEENHIPLTSLFTKSEDDFWLWDLVVAGMPSVSFPIQVPGRTTDGTAVLTVNLQGASDTAAAIDHDAQVLLNGRKIGESKWDGLAANSGQFNFYQSVLNDGENTVNINGVVPAGVPYSFFYVDSFDLSYQRYYQAVNNALWCQGDTNQTISVTGFSDSQVMVWDVSQPRQPRLVSTAGIDQGGRITFIPAAPTNQYLVIGLSAVLQPISISAASSTNLKRNYNSAEYLLIAPEEFANEAQQLADYRRGQGLTTAVVTLEDIYNCFNWGQASPLAIKDFLNSAYSQRRGKGLKYVVLVGRGTFDYKNYLGYGDNLVPVILATTADGLFAADNLYGDLKNNDGIPEIAIGRLPVISVEELQIVINKIKAYENSQGPWTGKALLIADNADNGGDFLSTSEDLIKQLDGYSVERLSLLGYANAAETRLGIISGFNSGTAVVNYVGHAGLDQLAEENIFNISDLPLLQNGNNLPIMILVACAAGRFDIPGNVCLSEALLLKENGGIVAALAPSSASFNSQSGLLIKEFYKAVFLVIEKDLGTAWLRAAKNFILQGGKPYLLNIFNLLGDPAVMFK
jgi:hypothetical protein